VGRDEKEEKTMEIKTKIRRKINIHFNTDCSEKDEEWHARRKGQCSCIWGIDMKQQENKGGPNCQFASHRQTSGNQTTRRRSRKVENATSPSGDSVTQSVVARDGELCAAPFEWNQIAPKLFGSTVCWFESFSLFFPLLFSPNPNSILNQHVEFASTAFSLLCISVFVCEERCFDLCRC